MSNVSSIPTIEDIGERLNSEGLSICEFPLGLCILRVIRKGASRARLQTAIVTLERLKSFYTDKNVSFDVDTAIIPEGLQSEGNPDREVIEIALSTRDLLRTWAQFEKVEA